MINHKLPFASIVLAAGLGKRMEADLPKVLHLLGDKPLIWRAVEVIRHLNPLQIIVVANNHNLKLIKKVLLGSVNYFVQKKPAGTADAVWGALAKVQKGIETVCVLNADDTSFYKPETLLKVFEKHQMSRAKITFITVEEADPSGIGRIIRKDGNLVGIVEEKDATEAQKSIKEVNDGVYFFERDWLSKCLKMLKPSEITDELYLTDLIGLAIKNKDKVETFKLSDSSQWRSVNNQADLKQANEILDKSIHVMGIAGSGASAVSGIAKEYGYFVDGCDLKSDSAYINNLDSNFSLGHSESHLISKSMLVCSPAVLKFDAKNMEVNYAKKVKMPVITWQEFQGKFLQKGKFVIAVAGAYGKSTTTAMISQIMLKSGLAPTCEVGAKVLEWGSNFRTGKSKYYVCEADEYNDNFLNYKSDIAVILNTVWDHPDYFKSREQLFNSYINFISRIRKNGTLVIGDTKKYSKFLHNIRGDIKIVNVDDFGKLDLKIIGGFRQENANFALTVAGLLNIDLKRAKETLEEFDGVGRRLEYKGKIGNTVFFDDYAVQPYTIKTTADALKEKFKDKHMVLVLEPHTFSRLKSFFDEFVESLSSISADEILITEVYPARERGDKSSFSKRIIGVLGEKAKFTGSIRETADYIKKNIGGYEVVCSMGAGDVYKLFDYLKK